MWAEETLALASTNGFDLHAIHRCVSGNMFAAPREVRLFKESREGHRAPQAQRAPPHPTLPGGQGVQDELVTPAGGHICRARSLHPEGGQGLCHPPQKGTALWVPGP